MDFTFAAPNNEEALKEELSKPGTLPMAGGTDLLVKIRMGKIKPGRIVSTLKIRSLHILEMQSSELVIGANVTYSELMDFEAIKRYFPLLYDAIYTVGSPQIRNRGTLVGNIVNASPAGDGLLALYLLDTRVELSNGDILPIEEFVTGPGRTALPSGEYIRAIHISRSNWDIHYFEKVGQRNAMTISIASVGWLIRCRSGVIDEFRIAFGSVAPTVLRLRDIEVYAKGKHIDEEFVRSLSDMVRERVKPTDDVRGSAEYRRRLCANLVYRMIEKGMKC